MSKILGTCGNCGGPVMVEERYHYEDYRVPSCAQCKAIPKNAYGPIIAMQEKKKEPNEKLHSSSNFSNQ